MSVSESLPTGIEGSLERLSTIVEKLEDDQTDLATSVALFKEGEEIARACREQLERATLVVRTLGEESDPTID